MWSFILKGSVDLEREEGEECEENMEVFDDSSSSPSGTLRNYPLTCKVLYSYKVQTHAELKKSSQGLATTDNHEFRLVCLCPAGLSARWVNYWWAGDAGSHRGWRHGGLGQGAQTYIDVCCVYFILNLWLNSIFPVCFRLAIKQDRWATCRKNTSSFPPPTVCSACSSLWQRLMLVRTRHPTQQSLSCTPTASTVTQTVSV